MVRIHLLLGTMLGLVIKGCARVAILEIRVDQIRILTEKMLREANKSGEVSKGTNKK